MEPVFKRQKIASLRYKPLPQRLNVPERNIDLKSVEMSVGRRDETGKDLTINVLFDQKDNIVAAHPMTHRNWCNFDNMQKYRAIPYKELYAVHSAFSLKTLAAMVVGYAITPEIRAKITIADIDEYVQRHTKWYWQIGVFNPIRAWNGNGTLMYETEVARLPGVIRCIDEEQPWCMHGYDREWNNNGTMVFNAEYQYGKMHGRHTSFLSRPDSSGVSTAKYRYMNGKRHGTGYCWDKDDVLMLREQTINGRLHGQVIKWHPETSSVVEHWNTNHRLMETKKYCIYTGQLLQHNHYEMKSDHPNIQQMHGLAYEWNNIGMLTGAGFYVRGQPQGPIIQWHPTRGYLLSNIINGVHTSTHELDARVPIINGPVRPEIAINVPLPATRIILPPAQFTRSDALLESCGITQAGFDALIAELEGEATNN